MQRLCWWLEAWERGWATQVRRTWQGMVAAWRAGQGRSMSDEVHVHGCLHLCGCWGAGLREFVVCKGSRAAQEQAAVKIRAYEKCLC